MRIVAVVVALAVVGLVVPGRSGEAIFALAAMALPAALLLVGDPGRGSSGRLVAASLAALVPLVGGMALLMGIAGGDPTRFWLLGLPLGLAIQIWLMTLVPLLVIGLLFALDFDRFRPTAEDVERIRSLADDDA